jgi:hypothetical protein
MSLETPYCRYKYLYNIYTYSMDTPPSLAPICHHNLLYYGGQAVTALWRIHRHYVYILYICTVCSVQYLLLYSTRYTTTHVYTLSVV